MHGLKEMMQIEYQRLKKISDLVTGRINDAPEGSLRVTTNHGNAQFFYTIRGANSEMGKYIPKKEMDLVARLAQNDYDKSVLKITDKRMKQLEKILKDYDEFEIEQIYFKGHPARQQIIQPVEETREQWLKHWLAEPYQGRGFSQGDRDIRSEKGDRVRSKSEKIIADYLYLRGISYKYEHPLKLDGYGIIYPDFTMLSGRLRKEIYLEHEGMMGDPDYADNAVKKIELYERNGILPGERLILTFETAKSGFNVQLLDKLLAGYDLL